MNKRGERFLIQVDLPGQQPLDWEKALALLTPTGIELDRSYGPICVDPARGRYVLRGIATEEARRRAELIPGVQIFRDASIEPASN